MIPFRWSQLQCSLGKKRTCGRSRACKACVNAGCGYVYREANGIRMGLNELKRAVEGIV